jgi:type VI protein secretion system component VasK
MNKIKLVWQRVSWQLRAVVIGLVVVGYLIFSLSNFIHTKKYDAKISGLEKAAHEAEEKANTKLVEANKLSAENLSLRNQLTALDEDLQRLQSNLAQSRIVTHQTKVIYEKAKTAPQPSLPLTGNNDLDRQRLCAELASVGIKCE